MEAAFFSLIEKLRTQAPRSVDVIGLGECSLDLIYPLSGRLRDWVGGKGAAKAGLSLSGGQIATAMCALRRLGFRTSFLGAIGDDEAGAAVRKSLAEEGVGIADLQVVMGAATRSALLLVDEDGERTVIEHRDAALAVPNDYVKRSMLEATRVLHVDATFGEAALLAGQLARQSGTLLSLDLDEPNAVAVALLSLADLCVVPKSFAVALTGETEPRRALCKLVAYTQGQLVVTLGADGCLGLDRGEPRYQPAFLPPRGVLDTTACGDTFRAALIAALLDCANAGATGADPLGDALHFASAAAALKCQGRGRAGCPTRAAVERFLSSGPASQAGCTG